MGAEFKLGDRVKMHDADKPTSIPAYRNMRGTVVGQDYRMVIVQWDCDPARSSTREPPEWIAHVTGEEVLLPYGE